MHLEPPTSDTAPLLRAARAATVAGAALACAALVGACGGSSSNESTTPKANVDTAKVARAIEGTLIEKRHVKGTVTCPAPMPAVPGSTFECIAKITGAKHTTSTSPFLVTIQNNRGYVTYVGK